MKSYEIMRTIRKPMPPEVQIHVPRNRYTRKRYNWQDEIWCYKCGAEEQEDCICKK